jgi:tetratricopeptide (TPR) repeat protein
MIDTAADHTAEVRQIEDKVAFHRALAIGYFRLSQSAKAFAHFEQSRRAAQEMVNSPTKQAVLVSLDRLAIENDEIDLIGSRKDLGELGGELAAFHARRDEKDRVLAVISKLPADNLYVSYRGSASQSIVRAALARGAIDQVAFYCDALAPYLGSYEITARSQLGQLQANAGKLEASKASFMRAKSLIRPNDQYIGANDVAITLDLALMANAAGMTALAREVLLIAAQQTAYVSLDRRKTEVPLSQARTAQVLAKIGDREAAIEMLSRAWSTIQQIPVDYLGGKAANAEALLAIAAGARSLRPESTGK